MCLKCDNYITLTELADPSKNKMCLAGLNSEGLHSMDSNKSEKIGLSRFHEKQNGRNTKG